MLDFNKIKEVAQGYQADMTAFLRAIVKNPGESCDEKAHVETIAAEMKKLDFDEVVILSLIHIFQSWYLTTSVFILS